MDKIKALEDNLSKLADKYNNLDQRRLLEIEGFKEDVRNLKKRVDRFIAGGHLGADAEDLDESDTVSASIDDEELDLIRVNFCVMKEFANGLYRNNLESLREKWMARGADVSLLCN